MSKIDELIAELCPEGVAHYNLDEVFDIRGGYTPSKANEVFWRDGTVPWFRMEDIRFNGRVLNDAIQKVSKEAVKKETPFEADSLIVATTATIGEHALITSPFLANQQFSILTRKTKYQSLVDPKFAFFVGFGISEHCLQNTNVSGFASVNMEAFRKFQFPIPPLEVQREIVSILDKFTQLEAELEAELEARRSQYEHTRDQLLDFSGDLSSHPLRELIAELCPEGVQFYKMADVLQRKKGAPVTAQSMKSLPKGDGSVRVFAGGRTLVDVDSGALAENLVISGPGIIVKSRGIIEFAFWEGLFSHKNELWSYVAKSRKLDLKFAYFYLLTKTEEFRSLARSKSVKMPQLATPDTDEYRIPIPPLEVQHEIVSILDKLDALVNDLRFGLPAEITARRKQYEYYRNQLLTFKELETA
jgi:type I restriction enzyme S subunit